MAELTKIQGCGGRTGCKNEQSGDSHPCPFQEDVNNDSDFECFCCEDCTHECAMDI